MTSQRIVELNKQTSVREIISPNLGKRHSIPGSVKAVSLSPAESAVNAYSTHWDMTLSSIFTAGRIDNEFSHVQAMDSTKSIQLSIFWKWCSCSAGLL